MFSVASVCLSVILLTGDPRVTTTCAAITESQLTWRSPPLPLTRMETHHTETISIHVQTCPLIPHHTSIPSLDVFKLVHYGTHHTVIPAPWLWTYSLYSLYLLANGCLAFNWNTFLLPMKLREGNVFTGVCQSVYGGPPATIPPGTIPQYHTPGIIRPYHTLFNCLHRNHKGGPFASYWNASLFCSGCTCRHVLY